MMATHNLSKPLNVFTPQAHKPTILNLHPNNATILSSSISGGNWRVLRQEMRLRDHLQPTETMGLSGPHPGVVTKRPMTRMCMCPNKRVPSGRSVKLEFLRLGNAPSEALEIARLTPHLLNDAECEFKEILWRRGIQVLLEDVKRRVDQVQFEDLKRRVDQVQFEDLKRRVVEDLKRRVDQVQFEDLKNCARRMEMSRKEDAAVIELLWYIHKCKGSHEINEAKLVLVEMLIYQGDYGRARETLEDVGRARGTLEDVGRARGTVDAQVGPTDARLPFYMAVVCVLLGKEVEAKKNWNEFNEISEQYGTSPPEPDDESPETPRKGPEAEDPHISESDQKFSQFKKHVKELGQEIAAVRWCK